jgi:hypothetical protein
VSGANLTSLTAANLSGTTLPAGIVSSSLTSVGTLASLAVTGAVTAGGIELGYRNIPRVTSAATTLDSTGKGKRLAITTGFTIPATTYSDSVAIAVGDAISVYNDSATNATLTLGTGLTAYRDGNGTVVSSGGTVTLAARGSCVIWYNTVTQVVISGAVT